MDKDNYTFWEVFNNAIDKSDLVVTSEDLEYAREYGSFMPIKMKIYHEYIQAVENNINFFEQFPKEEYESIVENLVYHFLRREYRNNKQERIVVHNSKEREKDIHRTKEFIKIFEDSKRKSSLSLRATLEKNEAFYLLMEELCEKAKEFLKIIQDEEKTLYAICKPYTKKELREYLLKKSKEHNIKNRDRLVKKFIANLDRE